MREMSEMEQPYMRKEERMTLARKTLEDIFKQDPSEARAFWEIVRQSENLIDELSIDLLKQVESGEGAEKEKDTESTLQIIPFPSRETK